MSAGWPKILVVPFFCGVGCGGDPVPAPWDALAALPKEPMRELLRAPIRDAVAPRRLDVVQSYTFVVDDGRVHVLDSRYRHDGRYSCVDLERWPDAEDREDRRGPCAPGEVVIRHGEYVLEEGLVAAATLPAGVALLDSRGQLYTVNLDPRVGDPVDLGRPVEPIALDGAEGPREIVDFFALPDGYALVERQRIRRWTLAGELVLNQVFIDDEQIADAALVGAELWLATSSGLRAGEGMLDLVGQRVESDGAAGVWLVSLPDQLVHVEPNGSQQRFTVAGLTGPIARYGERLYLGVEDGVVRLEDGVETGRVATDPVLDLAIGPPGELRLLHDDQSVSVRYDDDWMAGGEPLHVFISSFYENPKNATAEASTPCRGTDSIDAHLETAARNLEFLDDLPVITSVGITAPAGRRTDDCLRSRDLTKLLSSPSLEPSLFIHESPTDCANESCYRTFLEGQLAVVEDLGFATPVVSGMSEHAEAGFDWVRLYDLLEAPPRTIFFGINLSDRIPLADPRGKDPFTLDGLTPSAAWRIASASDDLTKDNPAGTVTLYPGDNIPVFFLGDCPNVSVDECNALNLGGGASVDEHDIEVMDLLVARALAQRRPEGVHTWNFHLPAFELYDYTEDCTESARLWSGESCEAARFQEFFFTLHQRWALSGEIRWSRVAELPTLVPDATE